MTQEDYIAGLQWLELKQPGHPLLNTLKSGFSKLNKLYLEHALRSVPAIPKPKTSNEKEEVAIILLEKEKKSLYGRRAKLSNSFHECTTDAQRADVSDQIQLIQRQIETINQSLRHYEQTGEILSQEADSKDEPLSSNGVQLMKRRNSIRASVSRFKRLLEQLAAMPASEQRDDRISEIEGQLLELKKQEVRVNDAIAQESI